MNLQVCTESTTQTSHAMVGMGINQGFNGVHGLTKHDMLQEGHGSVDFLLMRQD